MKESQSRFASLQNQAWADKVVPILSTALEAVDPHQAVKKTLRRDSDRLWVGDQEIDLRKHDRIFMISVGKAACPMARSLAAALGDFLTAGVVVTKTGFGLKCAQPGHGSGRIVGFEAGHPIPDENGEAAAQAIENLLRDTQKDDFVFCLISGGGSALLTAPITEVSLQDLQVLTDLMLRSGARIQELNTLRKHLERLKGGRLAQLISPAAGTTLVLSDVNGDPLDAIASGPTVPDASTFQDCWRIVEKYRLKNHLPEPVIRIFEQGMAGEYPETPKSGDPIFRQMISRIVANNQTAAQAALEEAERLGFHGLLLSSCLEGEARQVGRMIAAIGCQVEAYGQPVGRPACIIAGGETTVNVSGDGNGGRNLEVALGAVEILDGLKDMLLLTLATDGDDGATKAAGAFVDGNTLKQGLQAGMHPDEFLADNDSFTYFQRLDRLIITGPTQTNVNDLVLLFCF